MICFEDLSRKAASDLVLRDKTFNITKNPKYDGYKKYLASMVHTFLIKILLHVQINLLLMVLMLLLKMKFCQNNN